MTTTRTLSGLALAAFLSPAAFASYDQFYVLGDSLSDSGNYLPYILSLDPTYQGQANFTENGGLVWSQNLSSQLGLSAVASNLGGTNYAYGGARIDGEGYQFSQAASLLTQIQSLLNDTNNQLNSDALYSVWIGGNDIFWILQEGYNSTETAVYMQGMTANTLSALTQLQTAGARYILFPTIADVSVSPFGYSLSTAQQSQLSSLITTYNTQLMSAVAQSGVEVIPVPTNLLFSQIIDNADQYGFSNVTDSLCGATNIFYCFEGVHYTAEQAASYLFADSAHPTSAVHSLISDYVYNLLNSSAFYQQRPQQIALNVNQQRDRLTDWVTATSGSAVQLVDVQASSGQSKKGFDNPSSISITLSQPSSDTMRYGASLYAQRSDANNALGSMRLDSIGLQLWSAYEHDQSTLVGLASIDSTTIKAKRDASLGNVALNHKSDSDALTFSAALSASHRFQNGFFTHGPLFGLSANYMMLDGVAEEYTSDNYASALKISDVDGSLVEAQAGWEVSYQNSVAPYAQITWHHYLHSDFDSPRLALQALPSNRFTLPDMSQDNTFGQWQAGVRWSLNESIQFNANIQSYFALQQSPGAHGSLGLTYAF
jgi:outer membrane lipase/esterase